MTINLFYNYYEGQCSIIEETIRFNVSQTSVDIPVLILISCELDQGPYISGIHLYHEVSNIYFTVLL